MRSNMCDQEPLGRLEADWHMTAFADTLNLQAGAKAFRWLKRNQAQLAAIVICITWKRQSVIHLRTAGSAVDTCITDPS